MKRRRSFALFSHPSIVKVVRAARLGRLLSAALPVLGFLIVIATVGGVVLPWLVWFLFLRRAPTPPSIVVGTDGVRFLQDGHGAFVPWTDVEEAEDHQQGVRLKLRRGGVIQAFAGIGDSDLTRSLANAATRALERVKAQAAEIPHLDKLARGRRKVSEWLEGLSEIDPRSAGYRSAPIGERDFWQVVEHPAAPADARIAAAIMLVRIGQDGTDERLQAVADTTARPELERGLDLLLDAEPDDAEREPRALAAVFETTQNS